MPGAFLLCVVLIIAVLILTPNGLYSKLFKAVGTIFAVLIIVLVALFILFFAGAVLTAL